MSTQVLENVVSGNDGKGTAITFLKGTYSGLNGWKDKNRKLKKGSPYSAVIVQLEDGTEKKTRVKKSSYKKRASMETEPQNFEEAMVAQHPDIAKTMRKLCQMLAECKIKDKVAFMDIFAQELNDAEALQKNLKHHARWRDVEF